MDVRFQSIDAATSARADGGGTLASVFESASRPVTIVAIALVTISLLALSAMEVVKRDRDAAMTAAIVSNEGAARLLSETISQSVENVSALLRAAALFVAEENEPRARQSPPPWLREVIADQQVMSVVKIIELPSGRVLSSTERDDGSAEIDIPNMIDSAAVHDASTHMDDTELRFGRPIRNQDKTYVSVSRILRPAPNGERALLFVAYVDVAYFYRLFDQMEVGPRGAALVASADGTLIARRPFDASQVGRDIGASRLFKELRAKRDSGTYETAALTDGVERVVSYTRVPGVPLIVTSSRAVDDIDETLRPARDRNLAMFLAAMLLVAAYAAVLAYSARLNRRATAVTLRHKTFLQSIFDSSADCIKVLDREGRLLVINRAGACALEIDDVDQQIGRNFIDLFPDEVQGKVRRSIDTAMQGGFGRFTTECPTFKGTPKHWDIVVSAARDQVGSVERLIFVSRDVTERVMAERELAEAKAAAEAATRAKSRFLSAMSHELRTPLAGIIGSAELLADSMRTPKERELLAIQTEAGRQLLGVVSNILDWAKIEGGHIAINPAPVDLVDMIRTSIAMVRPAAERKGLRIDYALETSDILVSCDRLRVQQILLNFLSNAVKFTQAGRVVLSAGRGPEGRLRFAVHDTGQGVAEGKRHLLFQEFSQLGAGDVETGAGLGLAISRQLAHAMGGEVGVESAVGVGSLFWFEADLPRPTAALSGPDATPATVLPRLAVASSETAPPAAERAATDRPRVLLAEDNLANQRLVRAMLEADGYDVDIACDGEAAVAAAEANAYALILMDMQMPALSGRQATIRIRQSPAGRDTPILALTANVYPEQVKVCEDAGMNGHIAKPVERAELLRVVRLWSDGKGRTAREAA